MKRFRTTLTPRLIAAALVFGALLGLPARADLDCFTRYYGDNTCATYCIIYDANGTKTGSIRGPFHECT